jgi:predicted O-methyltransferase YrrM
MTVTSGVRHQDYLDRLAAWSDIQGHIEFLYDTACGYGSPVVIELGVRSGVSTAAFLAAAERSGGVVWSCDTAAADVPPAWRLDVAWRFVCGDDLDPAVSSALPPWCDVLFIDTTHDHDQTLAELTLYMPRLRPGGTAVLHDTCWAEDGLEPDRGVATALDAWCASNGGTWENRPGSYGMGVIHV